MKLTNFETVGGQLGESLRGRQYDVLSSKQLKSQHVLKSANQFSDDMQ